VMTDTEYGLALRGSLLVDGGSALLGEDRGQDDWYEQWRRDVSPQP